MTTSDQETWPKKVKIKMFRNTPDKYEREVGEAEYTDLSRQGLLDEDTQKAGRKATEKTES